MQSITVQIDVGTPGTAPMARQITATCHVPERPAPGIPRVLFCCPGGGYSRHYYDLRIPGHSGYSQAEFHCAAGHYVVAYDHLGVGDSSACPEHELSVDALTAAAASAVGQLRERLAAGTLDASLPALGRHLAIGLGQSMGGCLSIVTQARHASYDALAVLGYSAIHTRLPQPGDALRREALSPQGFSLQAEFARATDWLYAFHAEDVPRDIVDMDAAGGLPVRRTAPRWGSLSTPAVAAQMLTPGFVAQEAAAITVPVFIGNGEIDVCPDPWREPLGYSGCRDITLLVQARMAHMHNFASSRRAFWTRLQGWFETLAPPAHEN